MDRRPQPYLSPWVRASVALRTRATALLAQTRLSDIQHATNGDEQKYATQHYGGSFTAGLPHHAMSGLLSRDESFQQLVAAMQSQRQVDFDLIVRADNSPGKLVDPQASFLASLVGRPSGAFSVAVPPALSSVELATELLELYAMWALRDVPFVHYSNASTIAEVDPSATSVVTLVLNTLNQNQSLKTKLLPIDSATKKITPRLLCRGSSTGEQIGPHISQFLYRSVKMGGLRPFEQLYTVPMTLVEAFNSNHQVEFGTNKTTMIAIENGFVPENDANRFVGDRYIFDGRSFAESVHNDPPYAFAYNAIMILNQLGAPLNPAWSNLSPNEGLFISRAGAARIQSDLGEISRRALAAVWYQKWFVHRRLRPEAASLILQNVLDSTSAGNSFGLDALLFTTQSSSLLDYVNSQLQAYAGDNTFLLSCSYPEGAPRHPAYPSGHAVLGGAFQFLLRVYYNESTRWIDLPGLQSIQENQRVEQASADGTQKIFYTGSDVQSITVGSELLKLAGNYGYGRNWAGIHWRTDIEQGILLGEKVAYCYLKEVWSETNPSGRFPAEISVVSYDGHTVYKLSRDVKSY